MKKFEYKEFTVKTKGCISAKIPDTFINQLNDYGKDGWELIQAAQFAQIFWAHFIGYIHHAPRD